MSPPAPSLSLPMSGRLLPARDCTPWLRLCIPARNSRACSLTRPNGHGTLTPTSGMHFGLDSSVRTIELRNAYKHAAYSQRIVSSIKDSDLLPHPAACTPPQCRLAYRKSRCGTVYRRGLDVAGRAAPWSGHVLFADERIEERRGLHDRPPSLALVLDIDSYSYASALQPVDVGLTQSVRRCRRARTRSAIAIDTEIASHITPTWDSERNSKKHVSAQTTATLTLASRSLSIPALLLPLPCPPLGIPLPSPSLLLHTSACFYFQSAAENTEDGDTRCEGSLSSPSVPLPLAVPPLPSPSYPSSPSLTVPLPSPSLPSHVRAQGSVHVLLSASSPRNTTDGDTRCEGAARARRGTSLT
ncbi:hypothetical protein B0H16DRAFT_1885455 [Mycena metata]|uniref:Uncharacterized protein n=1 Tax=Mycena metata TaxID=1033252 RepID=A0AAD7J8X1_9AGAR|nr:hypothetical protein B0H16DRAFT_1885455 [Mycena metata]